MYGAAADLRRAEALETLRRVPAEPARHRREKRHRVDADGDEVDVLALGAAEEPVAHESADEVHLDVQAGARLQRSPRGDPRGPAIRG